mgnify:CR=1 FL=1
MKTGQKHLIQCHCILPQYRKSVIPVFHKFVVFSVIDKDVVVPKYVQCNNCNVVHKIYDICKSEIIPGRDELRTVTTIEEVQLSLPEDLINVLKTYECELPTWEHAKYIFDEDKWGEKIILTRDKIEDEVQGKLLTIQKRNKFVLENYINREVIK